MDPNFLKAFEKFMDTLGITYTIGLSREGRDPSNGEKFVCFKVDVRRGEELVYSIYNCYELSRGQVWFASSNEIISVSNGFLAFFDDGKSISKYFESKTRDMAKDYFKYKS